MGACGDTATRTTREVAGGGTTIRITMEAALLVTTLATLVHGATTTRTTQEVACGATTAAHIRQVSARGQEDARGATATMIRTTQEAATGEDIVGGEVMGPTTDRGCA